jgi:glutamyl-tRNA synthetase
MQITDVLRGEEWINSVPKHKLLYDAFGWEMPRHAHLPLLRNPDKSKLSKRKNPTSINYYRDLGYLPEALVNYLGMMGWSMPDEREIFTATEMVDVFELARISLGGPVFDVAKLSWLNGQYLRRLSDDEFMDRISAWAVNRAHLARILPLVKERTERFSDLLAQVDYLLGDRGPLAPEQLAFAGLDAEQVVSVLYYTSREFDRLRAWERAPTVEVCERNAARLELKLRDFLKPLFVAISGRTVSLPLFDSMVLLGSDVTRMRLRDALDTLGLSNKLAKRLDKAWPQDE